MNAAAASDVDALVASFFEQDFGAEPASSFHMLCTCCSEGRVDWDEAATPTHGGSQTVWLAALRPGLGSCWTPGRRVTDAAGTDWSCSVEPPEVSGRLRVGPGPYGSALGREMQTDLFTTIRGAFRPR
ncbi:hypothetical protein [Streptomyces sp. NPDC003393]